MATVSHINPMPWDGGVSQPGVLGAGDLTLVRDSASQVTVAAGSCYVALSSGLLQRVVMPSSTVLANIPAASASNFRLDQVVVNIAGVSLLAGTQGTGVTIANRQGAADLAPGTDQLHDLLVSSSGVAAGAANIRDRRGWARGVAARYLSTTASLMSVPTTGIELVASRMRLECSGSAMLAFTRGLGSLTSGLGARVGVWVDGALHPALSGGGNPMLGGATGINAELGYSFLLEAIAPGSHLFSLGFYNGSAVGSLSISASSTDPIALILREVPAIANNGVA